jgi:hypothetical protein
MAVPGERFVSAGLDGLLAVHQERSELDTGVTVRT